MLYGTHTEPILSVDTVNHKTLDHSHHRHLFIHMLTYW